jgi:hypothetical protein
MTQKATNQDPINNMSLTLIKRYNSAPADGVELIAAERGRQLDAYSYTDDMAHARGELAVAAACYAYAAAHQARHGDEAMQTMPAPAEWPLGAINWKVGETAIITLAKAGALIAAEVDRLMLKQHEADEQEVQP